MNGSADRGPKGSGHRGRHRAGQGRRAGTPARPERRAQGGAQELDGETGLPSHLVAAVRTQYDAYDIHRIVDGWSCSRRVTLRANTLLAGREEVADALGAAGLAWQGVPWYSDAFVLDAGVRERSLWELDVYKDGKIYLQSLSSMLPPLALSPAPGADVLDMCAAPGGKTSELCALAPGGEGARPAHVTACELSMPRAERLEHNLAKLGATNVQVMRTDARKLDDWFAFDQILLDAPCTGSGTVHTHDAHAERHLTPALADGVERTQRALLDKALEILKPGGTLVYSTCSILARENEDVVEWGLGRHRECELVDLAGQGPLVLAADALPTLPCRLPEALTVCPTELYEGFFVAKIRKGA